LTGGSNSKPKDGWMKVNWALCKKEDVVRFKIDLMEHTQSIEMLLMTLQMYDLSTFYRDSGWRGLICKQTLE
jgi:hypothetical protein